MATFDYEAVNNKGQPATGTVEAANAREAKSKLREKGLFPTVLKERPGRGNKPGSADGSARHGGKGKGAKTATVPSKAGSSRSKMNNFFACALLLYGLGVLLLNGYRWHEEKRVTSWPLAEGRVTRSRTGHRIFMGEDESRLYAEIKYEYTVDSNVYRGERVYRRRHAWGESVHSFSSRFPVDATIRAYYNPENPATSHLEGAGTPFWGGIVMGGIFALAGLVWLVRLHIRASGREGEPGM